MQYGELEFDEKGTPRSIRYRDFYFSTQGGLEESRFVFLKGNGILERWSGRNLFTIGELGFGTGLNFLNTWQVWREDPLRPERLHYFSCEKHPLRNEDIERALLPFPALKGQAKILLSRLPLPLPGFHRVVLESGKVILTLLYGDALDSLKGLRASADAWYLDGFAPDRNPEIWSRDIFLRIKHLTKPGGTLATYSAARRVRDHLKSAGFTVETRKGFGQKREMLRGTLKQSMAQFPSQPWLEYPSPPSHIPGLVKKAAIVGGGLAGCSTAYALASRGWHVTLFEMEEYLAPAASGNRGGVLFPNFSATWDELSRFHWCGFSYTRQLWKELVGQGKSISGNHTGLLLLQQRKSDKKRFKDIQMKLDLPEKLLKKVSADQAASLSGLPLATPGLYFTPGIWLSPKNFCRALVQNPLIKVRTGRQVANFFRSEGDWVLLDQERKLLFRAPILILANAFAAKTHPETRYLKLDAVKGQTTYLPALQLPGKLKTILNYGGYALPESEGLCELGATFERKFRHAGLSTTGHRHNLNLLKPYLPDLSLPQENIPLKGYVALRTCTENRWPVVGPVPMLSTFQRRFQGLRHGQRKPYPPPAYHPGLYLHTGHGSKGLLSCPLSSELLASHLNGEPLNLDWDVVAKLHPARSLVKAIKNQNTFRHSGF